MKEGFTGASSKQDREGAGGGRGAMDGLLVGVMAI